jgi:predicted RNase H-like HicB family nuclease
MIFLFDINLQRFPGYITKGVTPMKLPVILTPGEDGWIVVECPVLPGCISQGKTREEALKNIIEAAELWLEEEPQGFNLQHVELAEIEVAI